MAPIKPGPVLLCWLLLCIALQLVLAKYIYVHDETTWTKQAWDSLTLRFPLEKLVNEQDWEGHSLISSKGTYSKSDLQQVLKQTKDQKLKGILEQSLLDDAALGVVADLVGCKVCQRLHAEVWQKARHLIHGGHRLPSQEILHRQLSQTCDGQVAKDILKEWAIFRMGAPAGTAAALGQSEAWAYVLKARTMSEQQTEFEREALQRSCSNLVEGTPDESAEGHASEEDAPVKAAFREHLAEYSRVYSKLRAQAGLGALDGSALVDHLGRPDGSACKDYHAQCQEWADKGECEYNPRYMTGEQDQSTLKGYCRLSCGTCTPDTPAGLPAQLEAELEEVSRELLASLVQKACMDQEVCSGLSGQAAKAMDTAMGGGDAAGVPANALAATRYLAKAQLRDMADAVTGTVAPRAQDAGVEVDDGPLETTAHCYYVGQGWWSYELCPGHHLRQFHAVPEQGTPDSILNLGLYDMQKTRKSRIARRVPPLLSQEDLLPGLPPGSVPYRPALYTEGAECEGEHGSMPREAEVQMACSPDAGVYMLVREPAMCRYVVTLYHPSLCNDEGYALRVVEAPSSPLPAAAAHDEL